MTHIFFGIDCDKAKFDEWIALMARGTCPFCLHTGLKPNYGSNKKHIRKCAKAYVERKGFDAKNNSADRQVLKFDIEES